MSKSIFPEHNIYNLLEYTLEGNLLGGVSLLAMEIDEIYIGDRAWKIEKDVKANGGCLTPDQTDELLFMLDWMLRRVDLRFDNAEDVREAFAELAA